MGDDFEAIVSTISLGRTADPQEITELIVILTGTGDVFMEELDGASLGEIFEPGEWDTIYWEGRRALQRLLEIEAPIFAVGRNIGYPPQALLTRRTRAAGDVPSEPWLRSRSKPSHRISPWIAYRRPVPRSTFGCSTTCRSPQAHRGAIRIATIITS
jgi:hypothetical protein